MGAGCKKYDRKRLTIYVYIYHALKDTARSSCRGSAIRFLAPTFWNNSEALRCANAGISLAIMSYNLGRSFWTIGTGGVGQSTFTNLIDASITPRHGDRRHIAPHFDEELRMHLPSPRATTSMGAQDAAGGGGPSRSPQRDLYKSFRGAGK